MKREPDAPPLGFEDAKRLRAAQPSNDEIARICADREAARKSRDYARADQLRADLKARGVELFDAEHEWRAADGRRGSMVASAFGSAGGGAGSRISEDYIAHTCAQRERAREARDWAVADQLRDSLRSQGVEILDKERLWRCADGRIGLLVARLSEAEIQHLVGMREQARGPSSRTRRAGSPCQGQARPHGARRAAGARSGRRATLPRPTACARSCGRPA